MKTIFFNSLKGQFVSTLLILSMVLPSISLAYQSSDENYEDTFYSLEGNMESSPIVGYVEAENIGMNELKEKIALRVSKLYFRLNKKFSRISESRAKHLWEKTKHNLSLSEADSDFNTLSNKNKLLVLTDSAHSKAAQQKVFEQIDATCKSTDKASQCMNKIQNAFNSEISMKNKKTGRSIASVGSFLGAHLFAFILLLGGVALTVVGVFVGGPVALMGVLLIVGGLAKLAE